MNKYAIYTYDEDTLDYGVIIVNAKDEVEALIKFKNHVPSNVRELSIRKVNYEI